MLVVEGVVRNHKTGLKYGLKVFKKPPANKLERIDRYAITARHFLGAFFT
jgi:hypothetical protein